MTLEPDRFASLAAIDRRTGFFKRWSCIELCKPRRQFRPALAPVEFGKTEIGITDAHAQADVADVKTARRQHRRSRFEMIEDAGDFGGKGLQMRFRADRFGTAELVTLTCASLIGTIPAPKYACS